MNLRFSRDICNKKTQKQTKIWVIFEKYSPISYSFIAQLSKRNHYAKLAVNIKSHEIDKLLW